MIKILEYAARKSGKILLENFEKGVRISQKSSANDLVTEIDELVQHTITQTILNYLISKKYSIKEINIIGEETNNNKFNKHTFVIDPIDGTVNYVNGINYFSISIAYFENKELKIGVVYNPSNDSLYVAEKNKGAYKIKDGRKTFLKHNYYDLGKCLLITNISKDKITAQKNYLICKKLYPSVLATRILGSLVLDFINIAENNRSFAINGGGYLWDYAAATLIVRESGGEVYDWLGKPLEFDLKNVDKRYQTISCHPKQIQSILKYI